MTFADLIAGAEPLENGFRTAIPETWHQGRTAYGGVFPAAAGFPLRWRWLPRCGPGARGWRRCVPPSFR